ncbi:MAG: hypothetical protein LUF02_05155 [Erysipelotrichaceae bacterium]|nr:hypothetical protein [Erysipelotrichaceae bacterium]
MIDIEDIAAAFEKTKADWNQFLNTKTGEIVAVSDKIRLNSDDENVIEEIEKNNDYVMLPDQYELDEWYIMEDFAESLEDKDLRHTLIGMLNKRIQIKSLKNEMKLLGITRDYRLFKKNEFLKKAVEWCLEHDIEYSCQSTDVEALCQEYKEQYGSE